MGMFDSAYIEVECPQCGHKEVMECQTKETDCFLHVWHEGDLVDRDLSKILCIASCSNSHYFDLVIDLDNGRLTNKYQIIGPR
jgi:hypothetical protein